MSGQAECPEPEPNDESVDASTAAQDTDTESSKVDAAAAPAGDDSAGASAQADLQATADENWDKYLRAVAELENVRKRAARDVEAARKYALEPFARELLAVRDSLELGLSAEADSAALLEGSKATLKLLASGMEQFGISELDPLGEPFDPQQHEAMMMQPAADAEPGTVLTVYQKGYALHGRLLRPARVVVAEAAAATDDPPGDA